MAKTLLVLSTLVAAAWAYSAGAPESVCDDMTPKHPALPQTSAIPYKVSVSQKEIKADDVIDITISGKAFKGYLIQVRNGDKAVGSFVIPDTDKYSKTINCHGHKAVRPGRAGGQLFQGKAPRQATTPSIRTSSSKSAATHKNAVDKNDLVLKWKAPQATGNYQVYITVAEDGGTFWARQPAQKIKVN